MKAFEYGTGKDYYADEEWLEYIKDGADNDKIRCYPFDTKKDAEDYVSEMEDTYSDYNQTFDIFEFSGYFNVEIGSMDEY
jgi:hypothetical protein